jgi:hypothetical protein
MARRKLPASVLEARCAFKKHPERRPENPEALNKNPLGVPPEHHTQSEAYAWHEIAATAPPGVLSEAERIIVEVLAKQPTDIRENPEAEAATPAKYSCIESLIGKLGMTPADRARVGVAPPREVSEVDDLMVCSVRPARHLCD